MLSLPSWFARQICVLFYLWYFKVEHFIFHNEPWKKKEHEPSPEPIIPFFLKSGGEQQDFSKNYLLGGQISQAWTGKVLL